MWVYLFVIRLSRSGSSDLFGFVDMVKRLFTIDVLLFMNEIPCYIRLFSSVIGAERMSSDWSSVSVS